MVLGQILITAGTFLVLILFADLVMVRYPAFAWVQWLGVVIGAVVILNRRLPMEPWEGASVGGSRGYQAIE